MKKLVLIALASAAFSISVGPAAAQIYYSGPGYGVHIGPRYEEDRYERRRHYRYRESRGDDRRQYRRSGSPCPPRYSVQDGVCKPYTGR